MNGTGILFGMLIAIVIVFIIFEHPINAPSNITFKCYGNFPYGYAMPGDKWECKGLVGTNYLDYVYDGKHFSIN